MQFWNFILNNSFLLKTSSYDFYFAALTTSTIPMYAATSITALTVFIYTYVFTLSQLLVNFGYYFVSSVTHSLTTSMLCSLIVSLKFIMLIALLVFIRGGIPRYRFDHLTKIGWIKFLSLVLASILVEMLLVWLL
jgi:NADH:ubiquinone oxidoreductase subunit H